MIITRYSPDGRIYTEESLQKALRIVAQEGRALETIILNQHPQNEQKNTIIYSLAAPPLSPTIRTFMSDVTPTNDGVAVTLTDNGLNLGLSWGGARTLAHYTMFEYELQEQGCSYWPRWLYQAIRYQVQLEMFYHSLAFYYWPSPRFRTVNIVFGDLP